MTEFVSISSMKEKKDIISNEHRTNDLTDMRGILDPFARKMLGKKAFAEADVICHWKEIAGEETARFSKPLKIDFKKDERTKGTLWIEISGGAYALEIQSKSTLLISKVNTFFGYEAVSTIKMIQNPAVAKQENPSHNFEKTLVSPQEEIYIKNLSEGIQNAELEEALCRLGQSIIVNNKKK